MTTHFFLISGLQSIERLSWIEECLKFFFVQLYPETLMHRAPAGSPVFTFLVTGDALYSLEEPEAQQVWSVILSMTAIRVVCDRQELALRGISIEQLKMKYPDQVIDTNGLAAGNKPSFWNDVVGLIRQNRPPLPDAIGWLQNESPYMHLSAGYGIQYLSAGLEARLSPELYAYLDGIHMGHTGQNPMESENIGRGIEDLHDRAAKQGLTSQFIACNRCATARGYSTWDDGEGTVISTCAVKSFRIRDMNAMIDRFERPHVILSENSGSIQFPKKGPAVSFDRAEKTSTAPPVTILVTRSPYSSEHAYGAISFAVACAHQGVLTRVVFLEDGVYSVAGSHRTPAESMTFNIQDVINAVAGSENLHFFVLMTSLQKRGLSKNKNLNAVLDIGYPGLGKILFYPPGNVQAEHQRVLVF
ncbi:DsrE family protein [Methanoregula sp.]|uniref:DsrE family protein n=1 Tax=Methanoregula sp. TaxID=2052170 RepID=UPI0023690B9D|nr:DsrE family protein [Methanoregula sp.]MDD1687492.1 DsrE family protein [Methanoregula sp.]